MARLRRVTVYGTRKIAALPAESTQRARVCSNDLAMRRAPLDHRHRLVGTERCDASDLAITPETARLPVVRHEGEFASIIGAALHAMPLDALGTQRPIEPPNGTRRHAEHFVHCGITRALV